MMRSVVYVHNVSYVVRSDFQRSLSGTGSCPLHTSLRSCTECYSSGLLQQQNTLTVKLIAHTLG